jgi:hypothetical protein
MSEAENLETTASPEKALNAALAEAQSEFPPIKRERTVTVRTKQGGKYSFSYAPLDAILDACRPALSKHGLALSQLLENGAGGPALRTELRHAEGGVIGSSFPLPRVPESPQELGSLLTYLRRYAITALLGIATEEDDDGRQAADHDRDHVDLRDRAGAARRSEPASGEQVEEISTLIRSLERIDPDEDWHAVARGLAGGSAGTPLSRGQAETVIGRLRERLGDHAA